MSEPGETERLSRLYESMADGELEKLAGEAPQLTEGARGALQAEIDRRHLGISLATDAPEQEHHRLVVIRQFLGLPEALLAKNVLDSAGVESFLADEHIVRLDWFISNAVGGVKLLVAEGNVAAANELLNQGPAEALPGDGSED